MPVRAPEVPINPNRYAQLREDVSTWLAECLDGQMHSSYEFDFDGTDLIAEDGRYMRPILEKAQETSRTAAKLSPLLEPEVERTDAEMDEYDMILAMARGDGPNTLVAIWEIPDYVLDYGADIGGYRYDLRRAMKRIVHRLPNGKIRIESQSLDSGFRAGFESIYDVLGQPEPNEGPLYKQPILIDIDEERAGRLNDELRDRYDHALFLASGVAHTAGRTEEPVLNTLLFVKQQADLVDAFARKYENLPMSEIPEEEFIGLAAAMRRRMEGRRFVAESVDAEMGGAGAAAQASGETFSGCGMTLGGVRSAESQLAGLGYGNLIRIMKCGVCGGVALGVDCGNAYCQEKDCGSTLIDGKVSDNRKEKMRTKRVKQAARSIWDLLFGRKS